MSNLGRIKSLRFGKCKMLKPFHSSKNGKYRSIKLRGKLYLVHRLVAKAFIPNPHNFPVINHKDENPANNCVWNLEWCTHKYNLNYGTAVQRRVATWKKNGNVVKGSTKLSRKIIQLDLNHNYVAEYSSLGEASRITKIDKKNISKVANGKARKTKGQRPYIVKTAGGFYWEWK